MFTSSKSSTHTALALQAFRDASKDNNSASMFTGPIVLHILNSLLDRMLLSNSGPSGAIQEGVSVKAVTTYSTSCTSRYAIRVQVINELNELGGQVQLSESQAAVYLHVDDTLCYVQPGSAISADTLMHSIADWMEIFGFLVPERFGSKDLEKAIGFNVDQPKGRFALPPRKVHQLSTVLIGLSRATYIDVDILRCILGIYMFGAQLRRELMSLPFACYRMVETCEGLVVRNWSSVKRELRVMAHTLPLMYADTAIPIAPVIFASDAMGSTVYDGDDFGGYGVVAAKLSQDDGLHVINSGEIVGRSLA